MARAAALAWEVAAELVVPADLTVAVAAVSAVAAALAPALWVTVESVAGASAQAAAWAALSSSPSPPGAAPDKQRKACSPASQPPQHPAPLANVSDIRHLHSALKEVALGLEG